MSILKRILFHCKADINEVLEKLEDRELLIKQYLREMEIILRNKDNEYQTLCELLSRNQANTGSCQSEFEKLEQDLQLALKKKNETIAKMLIRKKIPLERQLQKLEEQHQHLSDKKDTLSATVKEQRLLYENLKIRAEAHCKLHNYRYNVDQAVAMTEPCISSISEEEIELELIRLKEEVHHE